MVWTEGGFCRSRGYLDAAALLCCQQIVGLVNYLFPATFSLSLSLFIHIALPVVILAYKMNAGSDRVPLWPIKHFGWFPEKGNDRHRQYEALHLLQTLSAPLTRPEADKQQAESMSSQVIQLMTGWMMWDVASICSLQYWLGSRNTFALFVV